MATVTLSWTASSGPNLAGYKIHQTDIGGFHVNTLPPFPLLVGDVLTYTLRSLSYATDYYFVVTAHNLQGIESGDSNPVLVNIPAPAVPAPPTALVVTSIVS